MLSLWACWFGAMPTRWQLPGKVPEELVNLMWTGFLVNNLFPVTLGNMSGGVVMVTDVYWFVYV